METGMLVYLIVRMECGEAAAEIGMLTYKDMKDFSDCSPHYMNRIRDTLFLYVNAKVFNEEHQKNLSEYLDRLTLHIRKK